MASLAQRIRQLPHNLLTCIYCRFRYWAACGIFDRIENELMTQAISIKGIKKLALDSTYVKVHPNATGALKKTDRNPSARAVVV